MKKFDRHLNYEEAKKYINEGYYIWGNLDKPMPNTSISKNIEDVPNTKIVEKSNTKMIIKTKAYCMFEDFYGFKIVEWLDSENVIMEKLLFDVKEYDKFKWEI